VLVDREIDRMIRESSGNDLQAYRSYLARVGRSESEYRESLRSEAERHVRRSLVLSRLAEAENLVVSDEAIAAELDNLVAPAGLDADRMRELFSTPEGRARIERSLLTQITLERVAEIARGAAGIAAAPTEPAAADAEAKAPTGRTKRASAKKEEPA